VIADMRAKRDGFIDIFTDYMNHPPISPLTINAGLVGALKFVGEQQMHERMVNRQ
jgi:hypothetical protein